MREMTDMELRRRRDAKLLEYEVASMSRAKMIERLVALETFYRQVAHAAGNLDQLSDGHRLEVIWGNDVDDAEDLEIAEKMHASGEITPMMTVGMIRRAAPNRRTKT